MNKVCFIPSVIVFVFIKFALHGTNRSATVSANVLMNRSSTSNVSYLVNLSSLVGFSI